MEHCVYGAGSGHSNTSIKQATLRVTGYPSVPIMSLARTGRSAIRFLEFANSNDVTVPLRATITVLIRGHGIS